MTSPPNGSRNATQCHPSRRRLPTTRVHLTQHTWIGFMGSRKAAPARLPLRERSARGARRVREGLAARWLPRGSIHDENPQLSRVRQCRLDRAKAGSASADVAERPSIAPMPANCDLSSANRDFAFSVSEIRPKHPTSLQRHQNHDLTNFFSFAEGASIRSNHDRESAARSAYVICDTRTKQADSSQTLPSKLLGVSSC